MKINLKGITASFATFSLFAVADANAAVTAILSASKIVAPAPAVIVFSAEGTTSTATPHAMLQLDYKYNYGDTALPSGAKWRTSRKSLHSDTAGPLGIHRYNTPGNYTVTLEVKDSFGSSDIKTVAITVLDPNVVYAGNKTTCYSNTTDFTGCPVGANRITSTNFSVTQGDGLRHLFKAGDTFDSNSIHVNRKNQYFSTFGNPDLKAHVRSVGTAGGIFNSWQCTTACENTFIGGFNFNGNGTGNGAVGLGRGGVLVDSIIRRFTNHGYIVDGYSHGTALQNVASLVDNEFKNNREYSVYVGAQAIAMAGNSFKNDNGVGNAAQHMNRSHGSGLFFAAHSYYQPNAEKVTVIKGPGSDISQGGLRILQISDNYFNIPNQTNTWTVIEHGDTNGGNANEYVKSAIYSNNTVNSQDPDIHFIQSKGSKGTGADEGVMIRNNVLLNINHFFSASSGFSTSKTRNVSIINNSISRTLTGPSYITLFGVHTGNNSVATPVHGELKILNNIIHVPNANLFTLISAPSNTNASFIKEQNNLVSVSNALANSQLYRVGSATYTLAAWKLLSTCMSNNLCGSGTVFGLPGFIHPSKNLKLQHSSIAVDSGTISDVTVPKFDFEGLSRIEGISVDRGAYEYDF